MKRRTWSPQEPLRIVLEGLKAQVTMTERCNEYQITQTQYDQWQDRLLTDGEKRFAHGGPDKSQEYLRAENQRLATDQPPVYEGLQKAGHPAVSHQRSQSQGHYRHRAGDPDDEGGPGLAARV